MDLDNGGLSSSDRQRQTAAEIARKKVLAAYSSTVNTLKNLPTTPRDVLLKKRTPGSTPQYQPNGAIYSSPELQQPATQSSYQTQTNYQQPPVPSETSYQNPQTYSAQPQTTDFQNPTQASATDGYDYDTGALKDTAINQAAVNEEWAKYHSAWQDYYKKYYSDYYAKAAQSYLATEKMKNERIATGKVHRARNLKRLIPVGIVALVILGGLFLQYNRLIFAPIMAYVSPDTGAVASSIEAVDPSVSQAVSPEPRLLIPKLNIDVPVAFNIPLDQVDNAMNSGIAQFAIPGANAMPGQIGNLVLSGHSAGDIYSDNPYKFIFSGLERLENGDLIYINYNSVRYTYQMTGREVVEPTDVQSLIYPTDKPILTLITCTPLGTSRYRLLISAEQISPAYATEEAPTEDPDSETASAPTEDAAMPANEPSFFEKIWQGIFGN